MGSPDKSDYTNVMNREPIAAIEKELRIHPSPETESDPSFRSDKRQERKEHKRKYSSNINYQNGTGGKHAAIGGFIDALAEYCAHLDMKSK